MPLANSFFQSYEGKMMWVTTVNIKVVMDKYPELKSGPLPQSFRKEVEEVLKANPLTKECVPTFKRVRTVAQFNTWLDVFYDYCDIHKIWCGP